MNILLVTPARAGTRHGNRITALRWARILRQLGHRVTIAQQYDGRNCDLLIALHARRSADSVARFQREHPQRPLVVALTGTDLYQDLARSAAARRSLQLAWRLVLLQPHGIGYLPAEVQDKARAIFQSTTAPQRPARPLQSVFEVSVVGHLRSVKDPLRTALAARRLPASSRIRVIHLGAALSDSWARRARREVQRNPRYRWLGELPRWKTLQRMRRSRLLVVSSRLEGAPNVASEALAATLPILASRISGMIGMLGEDYPGYFEAGNTAQLAELLHRAETDRRFYQRLQTACRRLRPLVDPRRELRCWRQLLAELQGQAVPEYLYNPH